MNPLKCLTLTGIALGLIANGALAADLTEPVTPLEDWGGFYAGVHAGWGWGDADSDAMNPEEFGGTPIENGFQNDIDGPIAGAQAGFNWQINQFVLGIEADASWSGIDGGLRIVDEPPSSFYVTTRTDVEWLASIRGRAGFVQDPVMLYATGGIAFAGIEVDGESNYAGGPTAISDSEAERLTGWVLGGGVEAKLAKNVTGRIEFLHYEFGDGDSTLNFDPQDPESYFLDVESELNVNVIRAGLNIQF